jgi:hypothetical protein
MHPLRLLADAIGMLVAASAPLHCTGMPVCDKCNTLAIRDWKHHPCLACGCFILQRSNGDPTHLRQKELMPSNLWGLEGRSSSSWCRRVKRFYAQAFKRDPQGQQLQQGIMVVDICNPKVNVKGNTRQRARRLARIFKHAVFLVVSGRGVTRISWDEQQQRVNTELYLATFLKTNEQGKMTSLKVGASSAVGISC